MALTEKKDQRKEKMTYRMALMAELKEFKEQAHGGLERGAKQANRSQTRNINERKLQRTRQTQQNIEVK